MAVLASKIINEAAAALFDPDFVRHSEASLLTYLNAGQKQAVIFKQDVSVSNASVQLVAGVKQTITGIALLKVTCNMGTGPTRGKPIRFVSDMDAFTNRNPDWTTDTADSVVQVYMMDDRNPTVWYCYPPQPTTNMGYVEEIQSVVPSTIAATTDPIAIGDEYEDLLLSYVLFRAFSVDGKHNPYAAEKAVASWNLFVSGLGRKDMVEKIYSPKENK